MGESEKCILRNSYIFYKSGVQRLSLTYSHLVHFRHVHIKLKVRTKENFSPVAGLLSFYCKHEVQIMEAITDEIFF